MTDQESDSELNFKKMEAVTFDQLLLKTAFCCMAADGNIDSREIALIQGTCENWPSFRNFNFQDEINQLVMSINKRGAEFINNYFEALSNADLSKQEELDLINFAIQTIMADEQVEYSEIKFFKNIRHRLKISNDDILLVYPDIEMFLQEDIVTESFLAKITREFLEDMEIPQFNLISTDTEPQNHSNRPN